MILVNYFFGGALTGGFLTSVFSVLDSFPESGRGIHMLAILLQKSLNDVIHHLLI
ncbi:MAG: hypothetical protein HYX79_04180 [Chloroflexi bacterium]|nr:hypothetical protein [Chloroflexota bacterium]